MKFIGLGKWSPIVESRVMAKSENFSQWHLKFTPHVEVLSFRDSLQESVDYSEQLIFIHLFQFSKISHSVSYNIQYLLQVSDSHALKHIIQHVDDDRLLNEAFASQPTQQVEKRAQRCKIFLAHDVAEGNPNFWVYFLVKTLELALLNIDLAECSCELLWFLCSKMS